MFLSVLYTFFHLPYIFGGTGYNKTSPHFIFTIIWVSVFLQFFCYCHMIQIKLILLWGRYPRSLFFLQVGKSVHISFSLFVCFIWFVLTLCFTTIITCFYYTNKIYEDRYEPNRKLPYVFKIKPNISIIQTLAIQWNPT